MNILEKFKQINEYFAPKVVGEVNDVFIKIAKIKGDEIPWHNHRDEDEMFYVLEGNLFFEIEGEEPFESLSLFAILKVPVCNIIKTTVRSNLKEYPLFIR